MFRGFMLSQETRFWILPMSFPIIIFLIGEDGKPTIKIEATYEKAAGRSWRFYCGTQTADWDDEFCLQCAYGYFNNGENRVCEVDEQLSEAYFDNSLPVPDQLQDAGGEHGTYKCLKFEKAGRGASKKR